MSYFHYQQLKSACGILSEPITQPNTRTLLAEVISEKALNEDLCNKPESEFQPEGFFSESPSENRLITPRICSHLE
jgi:hypothetical protein